MAMESDKVMFEIYREAAYTGKYRVVYYTELNENNKEWEINRALSGEHFYDGFIKNYRKDEAKDIVDSILKRLNDGEKLGPRRRGSRAHRVHRRRIVACSISGNSGSQYAQVRRVFAGVRPNRELSI